MTFMILFPWLVLALCLLVVPPITVIVVVRRRRQHEMVCLQAREKMEAFRAAGVERTQMMDFSQMRIDSNRN